MHVPHFQSISKRIRPTRLLALLIALLLVFSIGVAAVSTYLVLHTVSAYRNMTGVRLEMTQIQESVAQQDIDTAKTQLKSIKKHLEESKKDLHVLRVLRINTHIDRQFSSAETLIESTLTLIETSENIVTTLQPAIKIINPAGSGTISYKDLNADQKKQLLLLLDQAKPTLTETHQQIVQVKKDIASMPSVGIIPQLKDARKIALEQINKLEEASSFALLGAQVLPEIAGAHEERTYLVLFQNYWELRPAGGFIGTYGILTLKNGEITRFDTSDIYALDRAANISVTPPVPLQKYLLIDKLFLRDSNWDPDFKIAAQVAEDFYKKEGGEAADRLAGIVSITPHVIERFLELTGPITVEGYPYTFAADNAIHDIEWLIQRDFATLGIERSIRKDIVGHVGEVLLDKIFHLEGDKIGALASTIISELNQKHIMMYAHDAGVQSVLQERNWAGQMHGTDSDYLLIVDANLNGYKSDAVLERTITYEVDATNLDDIRARAKIHYKHPGVNDWKTTRYQTWTRFYVPEGSEFIRLEGQDNQDGQTVEVTQEYGKTAFGVLKRIPTQSQEDLVIEYRLPRRIADQIRNGAYNLQIQKQLGTVKHGLDVRLQFDRDAKDASNRKLLHYFYGKRVEYKTDLELDKQFNIKL